MASDALPVLFLSHGAGPAWLVDSSKEGIKGLMGQMDRNSPSAAFMRDLPEKLKLPKLRAVLVISAHWEEENFTINTSVKHKLLYDYGGFPKETYNLSWCPKGEPEVALEVMKLIEASGMRCDKTSSRGLDHGVFIPLMFLFPKAEIPCVELSIKQNMSMTDHLKLGEALQPLRNAGVLVVCSGFTTHNSSSSIASLTEFGNYIHDIICNDKLSTQERKEQITKSKTHQHFRSAHPTSDHFMPIPISLALSGYTPGEKIYEENVSGLVLSHFIFRG